jgi:uncharacterized protein YutE (UPF0331/DUF86 family)
MDDSAHTKKAGKREKFVQLAQSRTVNAIKAIRVIAKLRNPSAYEYTEADVNKIARALNKEVEAMKARMTSKGDHDNVEFEL